MSVQGFSVEQIDPLDGPLLRRFWEVEQAAQRADRAYPVLRDWAALQVEAAAPGSPGRSATRRPTASTTSSSPADRRSAGGVHRGAAGGCSKVVLPLGGDFAWQDDTLVVPEHRGHRRGLRLETATLERVTAEHPERRIIHTWTDQENVAMYRTNERFGLRAVETLLEMQRKL